jgi:hypothetical protein
MANRYWVGGTATWDGTAGLKWSLTSGGVGGQAVPTTSDTVFFTNLSGANTVTIGTGAVCSTLTMTGFTGTLAFGTNTISAAGTGTVFTGATTYSVSGTPLILVTNATSTSRTITAGSVTEANSISFNINNGGSTLTVSGSVKDLIFSGSFVGSFPNGALTIYGNLTFKSGMTITAGANTRTFAATSGTQKITSATLNLDFPITFSGTSTYQLQDALSVGTTTSRQITFTSGTLDLNGFVLTHFGIFSSSNSNTRSIIFGGGNYTNTLNTTTTVVSMTIGTGFTYTGTPTFNITGNTTSITTTVSITSGIETNSLNINVSSGAGTVALSGTFKNINLTGFTGIFSNSTRTIYGNLIIPSGITALTAGASVTTFAATNGTQQITSGTKNLDFPITFSGTATYQLQDALAVGTATSRAIILTSGTLDLNNFTLTNFGTFTSNNTNTRSIAFGTTGSIVITRSGSGTYWSMADLTGFTYTGTSNVQITNGSGSVLIQHGTTSGSEAQALSFAFGGVFTSLSLGTSYIVDLSFLSSYLSGTVSPSTFSLYGSYLEQAGGSFTTFTTLNLISTLKSTNYITAATAPATVNINAGSGVTYKVLTSATFTNLNIQSSFDSNSVDFIVATSFNFNNSNTKTLTINSKITATSLTTSFIGSTTGTTFNLTGSTIEFYNGGTFNVPNATFPLVVLNVVVGSPTLTIGASGTSQTITTLQVIPSISGGNIATIKLYADSTSSSTLNVTNLSIDGNSTNNTILSSSTATYQATISKPSGTVITNYLSIKDSATTGGAVWRAPTTNGNIDNGNNTGWIFGAYSANNSNFLAFF